MVSAMEITYKPIGVIHSPFTEKDRTPIQSAFSHATGTVEVFPEYAAGLRDIEGFSHLYLIYHFHHAGECSLLRKPFLDGAKSRGIFAIRHFCRPNPIGFSIVELKAVRGNVLEVGGIDVLDGTPLLDIKPYVRQFDCRENARSGWVDEQDPRQEQAGRYTPGGLRESRAGPGH
jgi:tRNA-Thr(GGU) m(6)t(6)A37 methyltransferase TsaA